MMPTAHPVTSDGRRIPQRIGLILGLSMFIVLACWSPFDGFVRHNANVLGLPASHAHVQEVAHGAQVTLAIAVLMLVWWVTEAVPLPVTALLPGILLPLLHVTGVDNETLRPFRAPVAFANYAHPVIYLFLGGFLMAGGMRKSGLAQRITLSVLSLRIVSHSTGAMLFAVMLVTAGLSMLISNTATTAMMIPVVLGMLVVLDEVPGKSPLGCAMMLGLCWSASLGGIGTLIGSPPNIIAVGMLQTAGIANISFVDWMRLGMPVALCGLVVAWALLMLLYRPRRPVGEELRASLVEKRRALGRMAIDEWAVIGVVVLVMFMWLTMPLWPKCMPSAAYRVVERFGVNEVGLLGGVLLFIIPLERRSWRSVLTWTDAKYVDWGTLVLFGGGLTLSAAMFSTGVIDWIAGGLVEHMHGVWPPLCLAAIIILVDYLTEITSNTAVATMVTPLLIAAAAGLGLDPKILCMAAAMAASLAFMLPVATPPNALVYGTGYFRLGQMIRAGCLMNLVGCVLLWAIVVLLG